MKYIRNITLAAFVSLFIGIGTFAPVLAAPAIDPTAGVKQGVDASGGSGDADGQKLKNGVKKVINVLLFIIGAISVIMIIIGGIKYTTSNGDQGSVTSAKNTILYAIVGVVIAILAYALVNFVIGAFA